jgi:hypothetical protein
MPTAAKLVEPALDEFYATLSSEPKARLTSRVTGDCLLELNDLSRNMLARGRHDRERGQAGRAPLVITSDQVDWALEQFATTLTQDFS